MVKNTKGGKGAKSMARKSQNFANKSIRFSQDPLEQYACVTKMLGNGMCEITLTSCSTATITERRQLKLIPEDLNKNKRFKPNNLISEQNSSCKSRTRTY